MAGSRRFSAIITAFLAATLPSGCQTPGDGSVRTDSPDRVDHATVVRVDASSGVIQAVVPVGPDPLLLTSASGQVWTVNWGDGTLSRVDPGTNRAATVDVGNAVGIASHEADIWVALDGNKLVRIDGATGEKEGALRLARRRVFPLTDGEGGLLTAGQGSLWLTVPRSLRGSGASDLWRIDPRNGRVIAKIDIGGGPLVPLPDGPFLWVITLGGLSRIDAMSYETTTVVSGIGPWGLAAGAGSVWMGHLSGEVWRIDPQTAAVTATIPVGTEVRGLGFGGGYLWVATEAGLQSIDPATDEVVRTISLMKPTPEVGPIGIAYLAGSVWVSVE